ncbi:hypothetical protein ACFWCB_34735 [Streptomyces sp. NPDC060048]|uniref:hypothetical protein n=1 Tax=unclassified Streptomyces TaxID=2593676 RepID=UPI0036BAE655
MLSEEVARLMMDPDLPPAVFGAIVAAMVSISETAGRAAGSTASARRPEQRRLALGEEGELGIAEYVIVDDAGPSQILMTQVLLY